MNKILTTLLILMLAIGCAPANAHSEEKPSKQEIRDFWKMSVEDYWKQYHSGEEMDFKVIQRMARHVPHGITYKLTHLGLTHKAAVVAGSPFYVAGFTAACVGGLVGIPFTKAIQDFESKPFVSF